MSKTFSGRVLAAVRGGHHVVVPPDVVAAVGLKHGTRVRGTLNGAVYRSSLMVNRGVFHLGVHKATLAAAGIAAPAAVDVTIEVDREPHAADTVPNDLSQALGESTRAAAAWQALPPSAKREHVKSLLEAKKAETRERRLRKIVESLGSG